MIFLKIKDPNIVKSRTSPVTHTLTTSYMSLHNRCYWFIVILMQPVPPAVSFLSPISVHLPAIIFQSCDLTCRLFTRTVTPLRSTPVSEITPLITARDPCFNFNLLRVSLQRAWANPRPPAATGDMSTLNWSAENPPRHFIKSQPRWLTCSLCQRPRLPGRKISVTLPSRGVIFQLTLSASILNS